MISIYLFIRTVIRVCSTYPIDRVVIGPLTEQDLHHVVVPTGRGHVEAALPCLVRDLQEVSGATQEETDDADVAAEGGQVQGRVFLLKNTEFSELLYCTQYVYWFDRYALCR